LTNDGNFFASVAKDPAWASLRAVKSGHVFHAPELPWGWFDEPPAVNRLIGIRWLLAVLYPDRAKTDLRAETREFYKMFYHVELSEAQVDQLAKEATQPAK